MSSYETDPLLPRDKPAPEIQGSRPQSIIYNDDAYQPDSLNAEARAREDDEPSQAINVLGLIIALFTACGIALILFPELLRALMREMPSKPQTIDQRVNRILSETPLIGIFHPLLNLT